MMTKVGDLLQRPAALPFPSAFAGYRTMTLNTDKAFDCDDFNGLGVTFIKGAGTNTAISASLHLPEVIKGINYAVTLFRNQEYLQDQIGEQIAELLEYEAVMASTFKFSAITLKKSRCGDSERLSIFRPTSPLLKQLLAMTEARYEMAILL